MTNKEVVLNRFIAKGIDFFIVAFLGYFLSYFDASFLGMLAGVAYILIADGFFDGQSIGKKMIRLKVVVVKGDEVAKCTFRNSILRNSILAVIVFSGIPYIGWFIFLPIGALILIVESYFIYSDEQQRRIGDVLGNTIVEDLSNRSD